MRAQIPFFPLPRQGEAETTAGLLTSYINPRGTPRLAACGAASASFLRAPKEKKQKSRVFLTADSGIIITQEVFFRFFKMRAVLLLYGSTVWYAILIFVVVYRRQLNYEFIRPVQKHETSKLTETSLSWSWRSVLASWVCVSLALIAEVNSSGLTISSTCSDSIDKN